MARYRTITIGPPFGGVDTAHNALGLAPGMSSAALNVDGDGLKVAKRYGISKEVATAMPGPIYDLRFAHPATGSFATFFAIALYRGPTAAGSMISRGCYRPGLDFTDGGSIGLGDASMIGTLHPAGATGGPLDETAVLIAGPANQTTNGRYFRAATVTSVAVGSYLAPGGPSTQRPDVMAVHRLMAFAARYNYAGQSSRVFYSDPDAPLLWPPGNQVDAQRLGRYPNIAGLSSNGDVLYAGGSHGIFGITGATPATLKMHPTNADFGFSGSRACDALNGVLYGIACRMGNDTDVPFDLFAASGLEAKRIGAAVRSLVLNTNGSAFTDARTRAWSWRDAVLFMPRRAGASAAARDVIFYHQPSGSFWRWTIASAVSPNCFEAEVGQMWMGCQDGRIRYFDAAAANDDGTAFVASWPSGPIVHPEGRLMRLRKLLVWGSQTSGGGTLDVELTQDGTAMSATKSLTLPTSVTNAAQVIDYPDETTMSYVTSVKLTFPAAGVGPEVTRLQGIFEEGEYIQ